MEESVEFEPLNNILRHETISCGRSNYRIVGEIGNVGGIPVYKAEWEYLVHKFEYPHLLHYCSLRYVKVSDTQGYELLKSQVAHYHSLHPVPFIIQHVPQPFYYEGYYFVPFKYMNHGSLLNLMATRFPRGLPELCRLFFLFRTLTALHYLHRKQHFHKEFSAAHIFIYGDECGLRVEVGVGYQCTMHDLHQDTTSSATKTNAMLLPAASVSRWAAAPDVYGLSDDLRDARYRLQDDVWLLGIIALELAYGGLKLGSREELEALLESIRDRGDLPTTLDQEERRAWVTDNRAFPSTLCTNKRRAPTRFRFRPKERQCFSKPFVDFVLACLRFDRVRRPYTRELLEYKLFDPVRRFKEEVFNLKYCDKPIPRDRYVHMFYEGRPF